MATTNAIVTDNWLRNNVLLRNATLVPMLYAVHHLPCAIRDYTNFYLSRGHATNVGTMFWGKDNALQPNWLHVPIGYHGRSSSVNILAPLLLLLMCAPHNTGRIRRPCGQVMIDPTNPGGGEHLQADEVA
jgi:fumarylacetoacetase